MFSITFISVIVCIVSCADKTNKNLSQTGLTEQNENLVTNTLIKTNTLHFTGDVPIWATNEKYDYIITTNINSKSDENSNDIEIKYTNETIASNLPYNPTDYYKIFVPYSGLDYYIVSYKDK